MSETLPLRTEVARPLANSAAAAARFRRRAAWAVIALSALYSVSYLVMWLPNADGGDDFFIFWSAGHWMAQYGLTPELFDLEIFHSYQEALFGGTGPYHPLPYPPTLAPALTPYAAVPLGWACVGSMIVTLALFLFATAGRDAIRSLALLVSPATLAVLVVGQIAFLSSALLLGGLRLVQRRPVVAGVLIGLLTIKPQLGLLVPVALIAFRAWKTFAVATVVALVLPIPSFIIGGPDVWVAWLHLMPTIADFLARGVESPAPQMVSPAAALIVAGVPLHLAELIQIPITIAIAAVAYVACRRYGHSEMAVAMLGVGTLLVTPYAWFYDLLLAAYAAVVLAEAGLRTGLRQWEVPALAVAWVLPVFAIGEADPPGLFPLALLFLFVMLLRRMAAGEVALADAAGDALARA